jgi:hypothetical protein
MSQRLIEPIPVNTAMTASNRTSPNASLVSAFLPFVN